MPSDFGAAIASDASAWSVWADITSLARNEWICWATSAKKEETRKRRIAVGLDKMRRGMRLIQEKRMTRAGLAALEGALGGGAHKSIKVRSDMRSPGESPGK